MKEFSLNAGLALAACLFLLAPKVFAHEGGGGQWPCQEDAQKLCKEVEPGGGRIIKCLEAHKDELSQACQGMMEQKKAREGKADPMHAACQEDFDKFCKDVKPGEGRIIDCIKAHKDELSAPCRKGMEQKQAAEQAKGGPWACEADVKRFCADVEPGEGRLIVCLKQHKSELSAECGKTMPGKDKAGPKKDQPKDEDEDKDEKDESGD